MDSPYTPPASVGNAPSGSAGKRPAGKGSKVTALVLGLIALAAAAYLASVLIRFASMFAELGSGVTPSPFAKAIITRGGLLPVGLLAITGLLSVASSFTGRRAMMWIMGAASLLLTVAAGLLIPQALYEMLSQVIRQTGP
jgi:hypothetical protein